MAEYYEFGPATYTIRVERKELQELAIVSIRRETIAPDRWERLPHAIDYALQLEHINRDEMRMNFEILSFTSDECILRFEMNDDNDEEDLEQLMEILANLVVGRPVERGEAVLRSQSFPEPAVLAFDPFQGWLKMKTIQGNLLSYEGYIVHQCNCQTTYGKGLSEHVFRKYPEANIYNDGTVRTPGEIIVRGKVIAFLAQKSPGKPKGNETEQVRERWFETCLKKLGAFLKENEINTVAFPYGIGCGLAGGNWHHYSAMIREFEERSSVTVYVYHL